AMKTVCAISLSLLLLLAVGIEGMVTSLRNKCLCRNTSSGRAIQLRHVIDFEVFHPSQSCDKLEYIQAILQSTRGQDKKQRVEIKKGEKQTRTKEKFPDRTINQ
uniref:Chemokine interleukin-8-like domain-containing protein n=1 Tax=Laticauda laticaudata TaxID=8630 RepID=A0A8C5WZE6_LATLA